MVECGVIFCMVITGNLLLMLCISVLTWMQITIQLGRTGIVYIPGTLIESNYVKLKTFPFLHANLAGNICPQLAPSFLILHNVEHNGFCKSFQRAKVWFADFSQTFFFFFFPPPAFRHKINRELHHLPLYPSACTGKYSPMSRGSGSEKFSGLCRLWQKNGVFIPGFARKFIVKIILKTMRSQKICRFLKNDMPS